MRQQLRVAPKEEQPKPNPAPAIVHPAAQYVTKEAPKSPELEAMEVVSKPDIPDIHDIDVLDSENPQLCSEYVKEIYQYMLELEVRLRCRH